MIFENKTQLAHSELASIEVGDSKTAALTVVFIHGWLDNAASFTSLLSACHHRMPDAHLVAIDLPGHGLSSCRELDAFYPFHDYIDDVHQFLQILSPNKLIIVGHSLGALIASCYSAAFADKVDGLVQIEGVGPLAEPESKAVERLRKGVLSRAKIREKRRRGFNRREDMVRLRSTINGVEDTKIFPLVERGTVFDGEHWHWRHDPKLQSNSLYRMSEEHALSIMKAIRCPQQIILGEQGFDYLRLKAEQLIKPSKKEDSPYLDITYVPGGHHCHIQQPKLTSEIISVLVNKI